MDVNKLSPGQRIATVAGALLFIDMWMSWYSLNVPGGGIAKGFAALGGIDTTATAWQVFSTTDLLIALTALVAVAGGVMAATGTKLDLPVSWATITAGLGAVITLLVLYRILNQPGPNKYINVEWGAYVGLILIATVAYGGYRAMGEETAAPAPPTAPPAPPAS